MLFSIAVFGSKKIEYHTPNSSSGKPLAPNSAYMRMFGEWCEYVWLNFEGSRLKELFKLKASYSRDDKVVVSGIPSCANSTQRIASLASFRRITLYVITFAYFGDASCI